MSANNVASDVRLEILRSEYLRLGSIIQSQEAQSDKILSLGMTIITTSAAAGIAQKVHMLFFIVPIAVITLTLYTLMTYFFIQSVGGYRRLIESLINEKVGATVLAWEELVRLREPRNSSRKALLYAYGLIGVSLICTSAYFIAHEYSKLLAGGMVFVITMFAPAVAMGAMQLVRENERAFALAKQLHARELKDRAAY